MRTLATRNRNVVDTTGIQIIKQFKPHPSTNMKYSITSFLFVMSSTSFLVAEAAKPSEGHGKPNNLDAQAEDSACFLDCVNEFTGKGTQGGSWEKFCRDEGETGQDIRACVEDNIEVYFGEMASVTTARKIVSLVILVVNIQATRSRKLR